MRQNSAFFLILALLSCSSSGSEIDVRVVSTQPHLVSGGAALLEVVTSAASGAALPTPGTGAAEAGGVAGHARRDGSPSYRALVSSARTRSRWT